MYWFTIARADAGLKSKARHFYKLFLTDGSNSGSWDTTCSLPRCTSQEAVSLMEVESHSVPDTLIEHGIPRRTGNLICLGVSYLLQSHLLAYFYFFERRNEKSNVQYIYISSKEILFIFPFLILKLLKLVFLLLKAISVTWYWLCTFL